ncbi:hypothetical protein Q8F55_005535 [Vanrija albida]|uniref:DUF7330 domain-containing protein n=1 Tax=Vanrija albida TaxID=181172 RepID=A0ABR3Q2G4_9TREE
MRGGEERAPAALPTPVSSPVDGVAPQAAPPVPAKDTLIALPTPPTSPAGTITSAPLVASPLASPLVASPTSTRPTYPPAHPPAVAKVERVLTGKQPLAGTYYLDPCLHSPLIPVPHALTSLAEAALSGASAYPKERFNPTTGAPIDGMAKLAKGWVVPPDGRFETERGGVSVAIGVVDAVGEGVEAKGRTKARVDVASKKGGVLVDLIEVDAARTIDLRVQTVSGNILVLLPEGFKGPVHFHAPEPPVVLGVLGAQMLPVACPYDGYYTTAVVPPGEGRGARGGADYRLMKAVGRWVPKALKEQNEYVDMATSGYAALGKASTSKVVVRTEKGKIVVGYRGTADVDEAKGLKLNVGADSKVRHWWSL